MLLMAKTAWLVLRFHTSGIWLSFLHLRTLQISEWILLIAAYAFVGLRLYTRLIVQREKLRVSEWILIVAAIDALGLIICEYVPLIRSPTNTTPNN
jgi:hypothetical protein